MSIVLVLAMVIPRSTSANPGPAKETPIPIVATATPTPIMATVTPTPIPQGILERLGYNEVPDPQEMEGFRREFLDVVDGLDVLVANVALPPGQLSQARSSLEEARKGILELTAEQLYIMQSAFRASDMDIQVVKTGVEYTKSRVLTLRKESGEKDQSPTRPGPTSEGSGEKGQGSGPSLSSFTIIPTPTPVSTPIAPAITHKDQEQTNDKAGDLFPPNWPTDIRCPEAGYKPEVTFSLMIVLDALKLVTHIMDVMCKEKTIILGLNAQDPVQCIVKKVFDCVAFAVETIKDGFDLCNDMVDSATIQALYEDTKIVHADLAMHDENLHTRFNRTDKFLFNFRNLNLRLNIEANLASPDDEPHALLALPRKVCISTELETLQATDPYAPEVIAGCGLLELVRDTVEKAIEMTLVAGESVHDAEREFAMGVAHYNKGEWKLAYTRFRNAYRDALRP
jgi:hypothetical protein